MKKILVTAIVFATISPSIAQNSSVPNVGSSDTGAQQSECYALFRQGKDAFSQKDYSEAENLWKKAIAASRGDIDNKSVAECMCGLAIVHTKQGWREGAVKSAREATAFISKNFGEKDPRIALLAQIIEAGTSTHVSTAQSVDATGADWTKNIEAGTAAMNAGNYTQAIDSYEAAYALVEHTDPDSRVAAATLSPLASAYLKAGDLKMAEATMKKALPLCKKYFADQPKLIDALEKGLVAIREMNTQGKKTAIPNLAPSLTPKLDQTPSRKPGSNTDSLY